MIIGSYEIYDLCLMVAVISFLGFVLENVWLSVRKGYMDNRNMTFPFLLGYGILVVGIYIIIGTPEEIYASGRLNLSVTGCYIVYFLTAAVVVSVGEIALGTFVEKVFGFEYWNYEKLPMHITKYTSIPTSLGFAFIITFFMGKCFAPIMTVIMSLNESDAHTAAVVLSSALVGDFVISFGKMYKNGMLNERWRINVSFLHDSYEKIKESAGK